MNAHTVSNAAPAAPRHTHPAVRASVAAAAVMGSVAVYALVPGAGMWVRQAGNLLRSAEVQGLRMFLHRADALEPLAAAGLAAYVGLAPWLPLAPLAEAVTGRLGVPVGLLALVAGMLAGATVAFLLAAALVRPLVRLLLHPLKRRLPGVPRDRFPRALPWIALLVRMLPWVGQGWVSYATGALPMRFRDHLWTATAGAVVAVVLALVL